MINKKHSTKKLALIAIAIVLAVTLFNLPQTGPHLKGLLFRLFSPIQKVVIIIRVKIIGIGQAINNFNLLKSENEKLSAENQELLGEIIGLKMLAEENNTLKTALGLEINKGFKLLEADIIGRDFDNKTIIINSGINNGIKKGMPVIAGEKTLIGKIDAAFERYSVVSVLNSDSSVFDAEIADKEIKGILKGGSGDRLRMELIPHDKNISENDLVVTTNDGGIYPKGLIVGRVASVKNNALEPFLSVLVKPAADIDKLKYIFIITEY